MCADHGWTIDWARAVAKPLPKDTPPPADPSHPVEHGLIADAEGFLKKIVAHLEDGAIEVAEAALKALITHDPDLLSPGFAFTETMSGHVSLYDVTHPGPKAQRVSDDYSVATAWGRAKGTSMRFRLTISTDSINHMTTDAQHPGTITGTVTCDALGAEPMPVRNGTFSLLAVDETTAERWIMRYDMVLDRPAGPCRFRGYKILKERPGSDVWTDVTTLFVTVHDGDDGTGPLLAQGILTLGLDDLMWQGSSVTLTPPGNLLDDIVRRFPHAGTALSIVYLGQVRRLLRADAVSRLWWRSRRSRKLPGQRRRRADASAPRAALARAPADNARRRQRLPQPADPLPRRHQGAGDHRAGLFDPRQLVRAGHDRNQLCRGARRGRV